MIRILVADDHPVVREGLKRIIDSTADLKVIAEASNCQEVLEGIWNNPVEVVLLDISLPGRGGLDILPQLKADRPRTSVLVVSMYSEEQYATRVLKAGADGYLTKESAPDQLVNAIRKVHAGGKYISPTLAERLVMDLGHPAGERPHEQLSDREFQVLLMIASAKTVTEIADELSLSVKTVSTYRARIIEKTGLKNNVEMARYALRHKLVT